MVKPTCFLDLDLTLYNTTQLIADIRAYLRSIGHSDANITTTFGVAIRRGYTFEQHLHLLGHPEHRIQQHAVVLDELLDRGDRYLLPGVSDGLQALSDHAQCTLLTFGHPTFQGRKFRGVHAFRHVFSSQFFVWKRHTKGDIIRDRGPHPDLWFLEDTPGQLEDVLRKAPWTRCVRMRARDVQTEPHDGDGTQWVVVESFAEFVDLVTTTT